MTRSKTSCGRSSSESRRSISAKRVDDHVTDAGLDRVAELGLGLVVAVHVDAGRVEPGAKRHVELATRGDIDGEAELGEQPLDRGDRRSLARVEDLEVVGVSPERAQIGVGPRSDLVLGVRCRGRAELADQVDNVASADLQVAPLVHPAPGRVGGRALNRGPLAGRAHQPIIPAALAIRRLFSEFGREPARRDRRDALREPARYGEPMARTISPPSESGVHAGRPYMSWLPESEPPWPAMVIVHGAGSRKENHGDFGRACAASGWAALAFDQRGHGASEDGLSPAAMTDVARMARFLADLDGVEEARVCVRGSSMGAFMAIQAAATSSAIAGAVAICPAGSDHLRRGLRNGRLDVRLDQGARAPLEAWLSSTTCATPSS